MILTRLVTLSILNLITVYLFVAAPEPLPEKAGLASRADKRIPIAQVFEAANTINHEARRIYTARIIGGGKEVGLEFAEDWRESRRPAGPLPALFLRLISAELTKRPEPLGLFLGSSEAINGSNLFTGEQRARFLRLQADRKPQVFAASDGQQVAMYPDVASAEPCISCHNGHKASPKRDWKLNDVMGATTWLYPEAEVSPEQFLAIIADLYSSIESAWQIYLQKAATFAAPPVIGPGWPNAGAHVLPDEETFMAEVYRNSAPTVMRIFTRTVATTPAAGS